ncbi:helix-turn-helix domain-containing protein [Solicola sp. PLA-1-18]|uniref:helix-turn-helix domain-containing protein n=1 Tax=Solicola sp. PLA-1-18 TaxID=3380532 RepID=UPI003B7692A6
MSGLRGEIPQSPDVQVLGDAAIFRGAAALEMYRLAVMGVRYQQRTDQIEANPRVRASLAALKRAAEQAGMSASGHADVRKEPDSPSLVMQLGITAAAHELDMTERHVRRLAQDGVIAGRKVGRSWQLDRAAVLAHRLERESA